MRIESVLSLLGLLLGLATFYFPYRRSVKKDREAKIAKVESDRKAALKEITDPLNKEINTLTKDRDYWRNLALEDRHLNINEAKNDD